MIEGKRCTKCSKVKPLGEFSFDRRRRDGRQSQCRMCVAARVREYQATHSKENTLRARLWRLAHPQRSRETQRLWQSGHRSQINARARAWRAAHPSLARARKRRYNSTHPGVVRGWTRRYRARKLSAPGGGFTGSQFAVLCEQYGNLCVCCGGQKTLHADHVIPLSLGGPDTISNIQPLCKKCNSKKGIQTIDYRLQSRGEIRCA